MGGIDGMNILSCSFGKDSLAMLLKCIETDYPIDEVVFVDTGMEFQAIYDIENIIKKMLEILKIKYTRLSLPKSFEYYMFDHVKAKGKNKGKKRLFLVWWTLQMGN